MSRAKLEITDLKTSLASPEFKDLDLLKLLKRISFVLNRFLPDLLDPESLAVDILLECIQKKIPSPSQRMILWRAKTQLHLHSSRIRKLQALDLEALEQFDPWPKEQLRLAVQDALSKAQLTQQETYCIFSFFYQSQETQDIARVFDRSNRWVYNTLQSALGKLRKFLKPEAMLLVA